MNFFEQIYQKIFPSSPKKEKLNFKEILKRSPEELQRYQDWTQSPSHGTLLKEIKKAYDLKFAQLEAPIQVHLFQSTGAQGFAISYDPNWDNETFFFLMETWKDQLLQQGYRLQSSEKHLKEKADYVEEIEKYYLKPSIQREVQAHQLVNQRFGNILMENVWIDQKPSYLKILVTFYTDAQFKAAEGFDAFMDLIFQDL